MFKTCLHWFMWLCLLTGAEAAVESIAVASGINTSVAAAKGVVQKLEK